MITKNSFNFSDSLVIKELERIGREKGLVKEEEELYIPKIQKKASYDLEMTGDIVLDVVKLADSLRSRGFEKQADSLVEKVFIVKKAMVKEGKGEDPRYDFWPETGEAFVGHAQRNSNGGVDGRKVMNELDVRRAILGNLGRQPTGDLGKAMKVAKMAEFLLKKGQEAAPRPEAAPSGGQDLPVTPEEFDQSKTALIANFNSLRGSILEIKIACEQDVDISTPITAAGTTFINEAREGRDAVSGFGTVFDKKKELFPEIAPAVNSMKIALQKLSEFVRLINQSSYSNSLYRQNVMVQQRTSQNETNAFIQAIRPYIVFAGGSDSIPLESIKETIVTKKIQPALANIANALQARCNTFISNIRSNTTTQDTGNDLFAPFTQYNNAGVDILNAINLMMQGLPTEQEARVTVGSEGALAHLNFNNALSGIISTISQNITNIKQTNTTINTILSRISSDYNTLNSGIDISPIITSINIVHKNITDAMQIIRSIPDDDNVISVSGITDRPREIKIEATDLLNRMGNDLRVIIAQISRVEKTGNIVVGYKLLGAIRNINSGHVAVGQTSDSLQEFINMMIRASITVINKLKIVKEAIQTQGTPSRPNEQTEEARSRPPAQ